MIESVKVLEIAVSQPMTSAGMQRLVGRIGVIVDHRSVYGAEFQPVLGSG